MWEWLKSILFGPPDEGDEVLASADLRDKFFSPPSLAAALVTLKQVGTQWRVYLGVAQLYAGNKANATTRYNMYRDALTGKLEDLAQPASTPGEELAFLVWTGRDVSKQRELAQLVLSGR
jgi:hypothetical protein